MPKFIMAAFFVFWALPCPRVEITCLLQISAKTLFFGV